MALVTVGVMEGRGAVRRRRRVDLPADVWTSIIAQMTDDQRHDSMSNLFLGARDSANIVAALRTYIDMQQHRHMYPAPNPHGIPLHETNAELAAELSTNAPFAYSHVTNKDVMDCCVERTMIALLDDGVIHGHLTHIAQDVSKAMYDQLQALQVADAMQAFYEPVHVEIFVKYLRDEGDLVSPSSRYLYSVGLCVSQHASQWLSDLQPGSGVVEKGCMYISAMPLNLTVPVRQMLQKHSNYCVKAQFSTISDMGMDQYDSSTIQVHFVPAEQAEKVKQKWARGTRRRLMFESAE